LRGVVAAAAEQAMSAAVQQMVDQMVKEAVRTVFSGALTNAPCGAVVPAYVPTASLPAVSSAGAVTGTFQRVGHGIRAAWRQAQTACGVCLRQPGCLQPKLRGLNASFQGSSWRTLPPGHRMNCSRRDALTPVARAFAD
jgi:hypothetical protein